MMDPTAQLYDTGLAYMLPVLVMMLGALVLGTLIGHWFGTPTASNNVPLLAKVASLHEDLEQTRDKLTVAETVSAQRRALREEEHQEERRVHEQRMNALNAQLLLLKNALLNAKREVASSPRSPALERMIPETVHLARMAEMQKVAARVPALLKEVNELRQLNAAEEQKDGAPSMGPRAVSGIMGKRVIKNDLKMVEGIGPKIAEHLGKHGLGSWEAIAVAKPEQLKKVLGEGGERFQMHDPTSWPKQCRLMVENRWEELQKYQRKLSRARSN